MQKQYFAAGVQYSQPQRQFGLPSNGVRYADCTSFGYSALNIAGYGCLFANPSQRNTFAMEPIMKVRGGFHWTPKVGDIVLWTDHFGVVVGLCSTGVIDFVAMGLSGAAYGSCLSVEQLRPWGSGTLLGFWTPQ